MSLKYLQDKIQKLIVEICDLESLLRIKQSELKLLKSLERNQLGIKEEIKNVN